MSFDPRTEYRDPETAEGYDARRFRSLPGLVFQWAERRVLDKILRSLPGGTRLLDAPCGTGRLMPVYLAHGLQPLGADISAEMMSVARRRVARANGRVQFAQMDFVAMPLADGCVPTVFSMRFLPHIPPDERVMMLREFRRVSGRWVVISVSLLSPWHRLRRWLKKRVGGPAAVRHPVTSRDLAAELGRAGLREVRRFWTLPVVSEQVLVVCERV